MTRRQRTIAVEICTALRDCGDYLLPEPTLYHQVRFGVVPVPTSGEIIEMIRDLENHHRILGVREDGEVRWKLTGEGKAWLIEQEGA